jgi:phthiocerol/phenolphthiocerol synthesis type-I polyketide synthase E
MAPSEPIAASEPGASVEPVEPVSGEPSSEAGNEAGNEGGIAPIAVVGLALRVPGARTPEQLWHNLRAGVESITRFTPDELRARGVADADRASPGFVAAGGVIDDADRFDAALFGMSDREAELTSPERRAFLECAWAALEHAGHLAMRGTQPVGVYVTATSNEFVLDNLHRLDDQRERQLVFGRDLAALTSERLGLTGPSLTFEGACSASLVAIHLACQALLAGECAIALAGSVCVSRRNRRGYVAGGELSIDGHCRAFDAAAGGAVPADGVGVLVLRRLRDAVRDRDFVHGVIRGSALNHTGGARIGIAGQVALIAEAMAVAEVAPRSLGHVELHGNGMADEEAVEIRVLTEAFRRGTADRGFCTIGSVKPNLGHAGPATGMAMAMKALAMLRAGERPPNLHVRRPNPAARLETTPFRLNTELAPWPSEAGAPRRAGVGVFGNGLCNAYLVLEEPPPPPAGEPGHGDQLLVLSAHTRGQLAAARAQLRAHLLAHPADDPGDVAFTLHAGRRALAHRAAFGFRDRAELIAALAGDLEASEVDVDRPPRVILVFPDGDAGQLASLARALRACSGAFRDAHDECARAAGAAPSEHAIAVATQIALARTWRAWGIEPAGVHATGSGASAAAVIAGTLSLADAMSGTRHRGAAGVSSRSGMPSRSDMPSPSGMPRSPGLLAAIPDGAVVLELGPGTPGAASRHWIAALAGAAERGAARAMIDAAARLWRLGVALDPAGLYRRARRRRIPLPTYPFDGAHHGWHVTAGRR